jgi:hypothetical protein
MNHPIVKGSLPHKSGFQMKRILVADQRRKGVQIDGGYHGREAGFLTFADILKCPIGYRGHRVAQKLEGIPDGFPVFQVG